MWSNHTNVNFCIVIILHLFVIVSRIRLISVLLQTVKRQFYLLKGHKVTSYVEESDFEAVQRLACQEKDREVSWADQSYSEGTTDHTPETPVKQNGVFNIQPILEFPILSCVPITRKDLLITSKYIELVNCVN